MSSISLFRNHPGVVPHPTGTELFRVGERGQHMYLLIEGEVDLLVGNRRVETVRPGAYFGEMSLIDDSPRSATARVRTDCRVFPVNRARFEELVRQTPHFALDVMRALANRLRYMDKKAQARAKARAKASKKAPERGARKARRR